MFNLGNQQADSQSQFQQTPNQGFANQQANFNQNQQTFNQASQTQPFDNQLSAPQGFFKIPEQYLKLISLAPFVLEMLTGQKVPPTGVIADISNGVQGLQVSLQQVIANQQNLIAGQQQLWNQLKSLENSASSQLTNLSQQVANTNKDFRILATETKKSLEFQGNKNNLEQARQFIPQPEPNEAE